MRNNIRNIVTFNTDEKTLSHILKKIKNEYDGVESIDFNKIIPIPSEFVTEKSIHNIESCALYDDFVTEMASIDRALKRKKANDVSRNYYILRKEFLTKKLDSMSPLERDIFESGKKCREFQKWAKKNWGTKCEAFHFEYYENTIEFTTLQSAPIAVLKELSKKYPHVSIIHKWADDNLGKNVGQQVFVNGVIICKETLIPYSKKAFDLAFNIWREEPADFNLKLNSDETKYIDIDEE